MIMVHTNPFGSYSNDDVIFLLKDISNEIYETSIMDKEELIQSGKHYSEMLPLELEPTVEYKSLFFKALKLNKNKIAKTVQIIAEHIFSQEGKKTLLVSLARAGTPIGILVKRYIYLKYHVSLPHYSISIIRGRGLDENAIRFLRQNYPDYQFQFIDGWTGKGAIKRELDSSIHRINQADGSNISNSLAVLSDPGYCANIYGTREDFLVPNACLNATVSGLISRTVLNDELISESDFHGAKFYKSFKEQDVSNLFIDEISQQFPFILENDEDVFQMSIETELSWKGLKEVQLIKEKFEINDINLIKPGVGETTRVLLRRVPWKILVRNRMDENIIHIMHLANEKKIPIEEFPEMSYSCCGIIKPLKI
ncbi:cysteine protease StiP family protein [Bacillus sp. FJAT-49736]|uniref:cysteine protease StiP family protein n=1 Tax=Bacillus sp. FJAT-49736 TaxID=2833582 RepID=UPI001BC9406D|nr:cysteine protease StiP family protein [Bacillus sp. FJAT-49736]MBS4172659.1 cysteine protease StiP family protein [Bacillus sp. FJAT-49736]